MKLALGTVQFGLDYGISNQQGQVSPSQVKDILHQAESLGIDTLDCAGAYGNSEKVLGALGASKRFKLIGKVPALTAEQSAITPFVEKSLTNLQANQLDTLLFHQADNLLNHPNKSQLFSQLSQLKDQQRVKNIGVSVYSPEQLITIANRYAIDTAQVPINIFDQRFLSTDIIELCQKKHIKLHARSLFLQGLLFVEQKELKPYFAPYQEKLNKFTLLAQYLSCSKLTLALALLAQELRENKKRQVDKKSELAVIDKVVIEKNVVEKILVGVCNTQQLNEIVNAYQQAKSLEISPNELRLLSDNRLGFINPSLWAI